MHPPLIKPIFCSYEALVVYRLTASSKEYVLSTKVKFNKLKSEMSFEIKLTTCHISYMDTKTATTKKLIDKSILLVQIFVREVIL
jgi:hypothetical protein